MLIRRLSAADDAALDALLDRAFGPGRRQRTAYRVREGTAPIDRLSFAGLDEQGRLIAAIQAWPVALATDDGREWPLIMVGPVAVEPAIQRGGLGRAITRHMLGAADAAVDIPGHDALMLIGDPEYYARFFGFSAARTGGWTLPGPFEAHRLLARGAGVPEAAGRIVARIVADA